MIRPAEYRDIPALVDLVMEFFANGELDGTGLYPDRDTIEFSIQDLIDEESGAVFVADKDGEIIGGIGGFISTWWMNANIICLIERGWFIPRRNREKYPVAALGLRKQFKKWGKENGASVLVMVSTVREETPRVIQHYKKEGLIHLDNNFIGRL